MAADDAILYVKNVFNGLCDSVLGIINFFRPVYKRKSSSFDNETEESISDLNKKCTTTKLSRKSPKTQRQVYSMMMQCCILNGGIFWMSILIFENYLIPVLQRCTGLVFKTLTASNTTQHLLWTWMIPALFYIFRAFWVIPLFWLTKPLNSLWYQEIANLAYRKRSGKPTVLLSSSGSFAQNVSLTIADMVFSILIQGFFLVHATAVGIIPIVGPVLSFLHMTLLYSLYSFEYTWVNKGWRVHQRLAFIESDWPYFIGFGLPLALLTNISSSFVVSGCIFAILFPLFIISANEIHTFETRNPPIRIFLVSVWLTNKILRRSWSKTKPE